jgi:hypothetical protein
MLGDNEYVQNVDFSVIAFVMRSVESFETPLAAVSISCLLGNEGIHRKSLRNLAIEIRFSSTVIVGARY